MLELFPFFFPLSIVRAAALWNATDCDLNGFWLLLIHRRHISHTKVAAKGYVNATERRGSLKSQASLKYLAVDLLMEWFWLVYRWPSINGEGLRWLEIALVQDKGRGQIGFFGLLCHCPVWKRREGVSSPRAASLTLKTQRSTEVCVHVSSDSKYYVQLSLDSGTSVVKDTYLMPARYIRISIIVVVSYSSVLCSFLKY